MTAAVRGHGKGSPEDDPDAPIHYQSIATLATRIRKRELSPVELARLLLQRIDELDGRLNSYATVTAELALQQAKAAEAEIMAGRYRGLLHGIPVALKDLIFTRGIPTKAGMRLYQDFRPRYDATVVRKLRRSGAVLLGKLQMTEGATSEHHPDFLAPINPWGEHLWPGVSSSGSGVAVAAGLAYGAISSDTGGSIRYPSAANGLTGVKPTWGRVSRHGMFHLARSFDQLGPMARSAADAAILLQAIAGFDVNDATTLTGAVPDYPCGLAGAGGARNVRIAIDWGFVGAQVGPHTLECLDRATGTLVDAGAHLVAISFPEIDDLLHYSGKLLLWESARQHASTYPSKKDAYGDGLAQYLERANAVDPQDAERGMVERRVFTSALDDIFKAVDVVIVPVFREGVPTMEPNGQISTKDRISNARFSQPFNASGHPTVTLPCGFIDGSRPVALQLVGKHGSESTLLCVGHAFQTATEWHRARP